jgi:hypothetical protein
MRIVLNGCSGQTAREGVTLKCKTPMQMGLFTCLAVQHAKQLALENPPNINGPSSLWGVMAGGAMAMSFQALLIENPAGPFALPLIGTMVCLLYVGAEAGRGLQKELMLIESGRAAQNLIDESGPINPFEKPDFSAVTNTRLPLQNRLLELRALKRHNDRAHDDLKRIIALDASGPYGAQAQALLLMAQ